MHRYRTHTCGELRKEHTGQEVRLAGWVHVVRDHGGLVFVDLRDHYGITQCVATPESPHFETVSALRPESVVSLTGPVAERSDDTVNPSLATGVVEVRIEALEVLSSVETLPLPVATEAEYPEETRLRYRFLDLRRESLHANLVLRSRIIAYLRRRFTELGFLEMQTPILTSSSPEGARDFLVPSRLHPGRFYALPQAPQIFKQLLMIAGFDRYFQIAPCFRDEESRADRTPGEFYQLDIEMSFVEQEDVFEVVEKVLKETFDEFGDKPTTPLPFPRIPYADAMLRYGSDKPDLRNPLEFRDVTSLFADSGFATFEKVIAEGGVVRALPGPGCAAKSRSFFDRLIDFARSLGAPGLAYVSLDAGGAKGPIAKFVPAERIAAIRDAVGVGDGDAVFFVCDKPARAAEIGGALRDHLGGLLELVDPDRFAFCWIVDFPMYELGDDGVTVQFSHNPFSMPQGGMEALRSLDPLDVLAFQYDIVCNGRELSSGAIRNHDPEIMTKAFEIAGYGAEEVEQQFGSLFHAFRYGAPPHGGIAPGIDRIVMLIADEPNLREVIAFPMNQRAQDLLMNAPSEVPEEKLRELHLRLAPSAKREP